MRRKGESAASQTSQPISTQRSSSLVQKYCFQKRKSSIVSRDDEKTTRESLRGSVSMRREAKENPLGSGASFL